MVMLVLVQLLLMIKISLLRTEKPFLQFSKLILLFLISCFSVIAPSFFVIIMFAVAVVSKSFVVVLLITCKSSWYPIIV